MNIWRNHKILNIKSKKTAKYFLKGTHGVGHEVLLDLLDLLLSQVSKIETSFLQGRKSLWDLSPVACYVAESGLNSVIFTRAVVTLTASLPNWASAGHT